MNLMTDIKPLVLARVTLALCIVSLALGCADQRNQPDCADVFESRLEKSNFKVYKKWARSTRANGAHSNAMRSRATHGEL